MTRRRAGIALVAALLLLGLLGLLIAGAVASTAAAQRSVRLTMTSEVTSGAADFALASVLTDPVGFGFADAILGVPLTFSVSDGAHSGAATTVAATRLAGGVVWLVADAAVDGVDQGHRRLGMVARYPSIGALPAAAIVARGAVITGGAAFSADSAGDADCARPPAASWVASSDSSSFYLTARQTALLDSTPAVRHVRGDTTIAGGEFRGILVIDGSLVVTGNWSATGLILVRGAVRATGTLNVIGGLTAFASGTSVEIAAGAIRYAPCVIAREIRVAMPPRAVAGRAWAELF